MGNTFTSVSVATQSRLSTTMLATWALLVTVAIPYLYTPLGRPINQFRLVTIMIAVGVGGGLGAITYLVETGQPDLAGRLPAVIIIGIGGLAALGSVLIMVPWILSDQYYLYFTVYGLGLILVGCGVVFSVGWLLHRNGRAYLSLLVLAAGTVTTTLVPLVYDGLVPIQSDAVYVALIPLLVTVPIATVAAAKRAELFHERAASS